MHAPFAFVSVLLATTGVASGSDTLQNAPLVALPVTEVVVFSDRARVTRHAPVRLAGGIQRLRLPDLPGTLLPGTLRLTATGTDVVRVETQKVQRERFGIEEVDRWLAQAESLLDQEAATRGRLRALRHELRLLAEVRVAPPVPEKDRVEKALPVAAKSWKDALDRLALRQAEGRALERQIEGELRVLVEERKRLQREIAARDLGGFSDLQHVVVAVVDGRAGEATLTVEYAVPGASWRPSYELSFDPERGVARLATAGVVSQATGEAWNDIRLALSTAIPGEGIVLPQLATWTLGDDREFVPVSVPKLPLPSPTPLVVPPASRRVADVEAAPLHDLTIERMTALRTLLAGPDENVLGDADDQLRLGIGDLGSDGDEGLGDDGDNRELERSLGSPASSAPSSLPAKKLAVPPSMPLPMSVPMEESFESDANVDDADATASRSSSSSRAAPRGPAGSSSLVLSARDRWTQPDFSDPFLPAVSAGGFDVVFPAPLPVNIPHGAQALRVPLATRQDAVTTFYEATPALSTTAYLKATMKNGAGVPLLAGPAHVFVKGAFVGEAVLQTTGPGGELELPLGADEDIRITRTIVPRTKTKGFVVGTEDVTDYAITIEVANYKSRPITLRLVDQVPKTLSDKVRVEWVSSRPAPQVAVETAEGPQVVDGEGLVRWMIEVPAGGTKTVSFAYRIVRPRDWKVFQ
jgi:hypothetical protein